VSLTSLGVGASALALSAYIDAKFHIRHDIASNTLGRSPANAIEYITNKSIQDRLLQAHILEENAKNPSVRDNVFLVFPSDGRQWTYGQFYEEICRVGNWLVQELGVKKNELVAMNGGNSPEYLILWFGLDMIGACPAFINCHLTGKALVQSRVGSQDTILSEIILPKEITPWPTYPLKTRLRASPSLFIHKMPSEPVTVRRETTPEKRSAVWI
jgi:hypothetical protein